MGEVERVHGTYNSTFGHDFRHRVDAASRDKKRGSSEQHSPQQENAEDVLELHEESSQASLSTGTSVNAPIDGLDLSA